MYTIPPEFTCVTWRILLIRSAFNQVLISFSTSTSLPLNMVIFIVERFCRTDTAIAIPARLKLTTQDASGGAHRVIALPIKCSVAANGGIKSLDSLCRVLRLRRRFGRLLSDALADFYETTSHFCVLRGFPLQGCVSFRALDRTH